MTGNQPVGLGLAVAGLQALLEKAKGARRFLQGDSRAGWVTMPGLRFADRGHHAGKRRGISDLGAGRRRRDGKLYPDPKRKGKTFVSSFGSCAQHGYKGDWREMRACDNGDRPSASASSGWRAAMASLQLA